MLGLDALGKVLYQTCPELSRSSIRAATDIMETKGRMLSMERKDPMGSHDMHWVISMYISKPSRLGILVRNCLRVELENS